MRKKSLTVLTALSLASMAFTVSTYAGNRAGTASFGLGAGYDYFSSKREIKNTGIPFVQAGYNFTDRWGIEGLLGFFNTQFKQSVQDNRQINGTLVAVDGVYRLIPYQSFEPYLLAGVGAIGLNPNRNEAHNEGNINAGIGGEFFIEKSIAFRLEARDFYTMVGEKNDVFFDGGITFLLDLC